MKVWNVNDSYSFSIFIQGVIIQEQTEVVHQVWDLWIRDPKLRKYIYDKNK